jgi:hypothetical protein
MCRGRCLTRSVEDGWPSPAYSSKRLYSAPLSKQSRIAWPGGSVPVEGLEDFKSALDDMRLRLWGLVSSAGGADYKGFQERFRIQRATEMCRGLKGELLGGQVNRRHPELTGLQAAASELIRSIEQARQQAFSL